LELAKRRVIMRQWNIFYSNQNMVFPGEITSPLMVNAIVAMVEKLLPQMITPMALATEITSL
jgi:hypothetical protein